MFFSKEGSRGGGHKIKNDGFRALRVPGGFLGGEFSRLGVPGGLQASSSRFFLRQGGPLGAAKACIIANYDGKTCVFLMILLFALSGLSGIPGSVKI